MSTSLAERPAALLPEKDRIHQAADVRRRILVVDDDPGVLGLVCAVLELLDVDVETCADPLTALARFDEARHDVVISDDRMPKMSGREMLARVRGSRPETPTILITGYGSPAALDDAYERTGVFRFVNKPWNNRELLATVEDALRAKRALS